MVRYPDRWEKFGYDLSGNRKSRVTGEVEENYTYDVRNRLLQVVRTAGNGVTTLEEGSPAGTAEDGYGTVKDRDEVWRYEYDRQGNLLKDNYAEYSYDGFNRMEKAETFTGKIQVNHYDAEGLRHEIEENGRLVGFIFSDREVVAESSKEDTIRYIRGYDILCSDSECARTYYHYVCYEGGSTSHVLDETGKVLNQYEYDAFGNLIKVQEEVNNRFLYVGQQYDAITMQYYLRARYYNPVVARFTQEDIYRGDGLNLYAYCQNNPVGYYDPSGYSTDGCGIGKNGNSKASTGNENDNEFRKADYIVTPNGTVMSTREDINLVDANTPTNQGGDWFQIHNTHEHDGLLPHTHYPEVNNDNGKGNRERRYGETTAEDIDYADKSLKDGTLRKRKNRKNKGGK